MEHVVAGTSGVHHGGELWPCPPSSVSLGRLPVLRLALSEAFPILEIILVKI